MSTKLDCALALAREGFRVFPLAINGKVPALETDWRKAATTDPERIRSLWTDPVFDSPIDYNIGIALPPDIVVVDVDVRDGKEGAASLQLLEAIYEPLPQTYTVDTASGGGHRYMRSPRDSGTYPKELAKHIDLKGHGGYVVGPGSEIDGRPYTARGEGGCSEIALAPRWLCDLPTVKRREDRDGVGREGLAPIGELDTEHAIARAVEYLKAAPDHGTFKVAARLKDFGVSRDRCTKLMLDHWAGADTRDMDHISFRVGNAFRYGQNAPGVASAEAEFPAAELNETKPAPRRGLYAVHWSDAKPILDRPYLIDDVMDMGSMVVTYGDSNVGKTYVVLDQARCIASGADWCGHKVKQGLVVYVASEGGSGFYKRIEAYRRTYGLAKLPFALVPCPIDLHSTGDAGDTGRLIRLIREQEAHFGMPCVLIVVDTLARAMGAGDENTSVDMGLLVRHCDRLRAATGATVNLIHHTGKDKSKGARGSSALRAATDTEIEINSGTLTVQKQRDMAPVAAKPFQLRAVPIGQRSDGREVTACVVEWSAATCEIELSPEAQQMLDILKRLIAARQDEIEQDDNSDISDIENVRIPWAEWQKSVRLEMKGPRGSPIARQRLFILRPELSDSGLVKRDSQDQWFIPRSPINRTESDLVSDSNPHESD